MLNEQYIDDDFIGIQCHCPQCDKDYYRTRGMVRYQYDGKTFCTWNCKCAYRRLHPFETHRRQRRTTARKPNRPKVIQLEVDKSTKTSLINSLIEIDPTAERKILYAKTKAELQALLAEARRINTLL